MKIDATQFANIVKLSFAGTDATLSPADAELVIAIAQLVIAADRVDDPDERALFNAVAMHVYKVAKVATTPPTLAPIDDEEQRVEHLRSHAAQLTGKPAASLAFSVAYLLTIADLDIAPEEGELLEILSEALGLDGDRCDDLAARVGEMITPEA